MASDDDDELEKTSVGDAGELRAALAAARAERSRAYFIVLTGTNAGEMMRVAEVETILGRSPTATVRLNDEGVSRKHARVVQSNGAVILTDLGSANGTLVNGEMVTGPHTLKDGDKVQLGSTTILKFTYTDDLEENFQQKMYDAAQRDGLTKTFNKRYFLERLDTEIAFARRHRAQLSLVMFDVDHFKKINDTRGHLAGDEVLSSLAKLVQGAIRVEDVLARYGGEEFVVICRGVTLNDARAFAERVRALVEAAKFEYESVRIPLTISLGASSFSGDGTGTELIASADAALYEAKKSGRNRVVAR